MPSDLCLCVTFPENASMTFPAGSTVTIPGAPPFNLAETMEFPFQAGTSITFPSGNPLFVTPPGQPPFNLDPSAGTITIPGGQPFQLGTLSDMGLGISFPSGTTISFPGEQRPPVQLSGGSVVRLRRVPGITDSPHRPDS